MEYQFNYNLVVEELKAELGEHEFIRIPVNIRNLLIESRRQLMHSRIMEQAAADYNTNFISIRSQISDEQLLLPKVPFNNNTIFPSTRHHVSRLVTWPLTEFIPSSAIEHIPVYNRNDLRTIFPRLLDMYQQYIDNDPFAYFFFQIVSPSNVYASTSSVFMYNATSIRSRELILDSAMNAINNLVHTILDQVYGYGDILYNENVTMTIVYKIFYVPSPTSIKLWKFPPSFKIKPVLSFQNFKLFTAPQLTTSCVQQCLDFCNLTDENELYNLCTVTLPSYATYITDVTNYKNFVLKHGHSFPVSIDVDTYILLEYNGHIGIIHNITHKYSISRSKKCTSYQALRTRRYKQVTVCYDIECYFDPSSDTKHIPYLCCMSFVLGDKVLDPVSFKTSKCVLYMLDFITTMIQEFHTSEVELIAHNGGAYDFHYLLSSLPDPSTIHSILIRNNAFISFNFKYKSVLFKVKDSYSFLLCSLDNAAKSFLGRTSGGRKTEFPHHEMKTFEDLERLSHSWSSIQTSLNLQKLGHTQTDKENDLDDISFEEIRPSKVLTIKADIVTQYVPGTEQRRLIDWAEEYCKNDVRVLGQIWVEFKKAVAEIFKANVVDQCFTLAGMSFKLFCAYLSPTVFLEHPDHEQYLNMRHALFGGRCVSSNGLYNDILCLDVKSLYPAAMAFYEQPYGKCILVTEPHDHLLGIYHVRITFTHRASSNTGFFPIRLNNQIAYSVPDTTQHYIGWYTTVDLNIAKEEGYIVEYIPFDSEHKYIGYEWMEKGYIFHDYITNILYKYKLKFEEEHNHVKRNVIKIIMNSLWGKFAQKWIDTSYSIKHVSDMRKDTVQTEFYDIWSTDYVLSKERDESKGSAKPLQNGIYTLSWARWHMKKIWDACALPGAICVYSDTDSICVEASKFNINATFALNNSTTHVIGTDIGQLENECTFSTLLCAGKKQYFGFYNDSNGDVKEKKRFKGIPQSYIHPDMYTHILADSSNTVIVDFLKFRRKWGIVHGTIESKKVKAT